MDYPKFFLGSFSDIESVEDFNEPYLLSQLNPGDRHTIWAATLVLRTYGTDLSVEPLKQCCLPPIRDVQITSLFTLQIIKGPDIADFAAYLLTEKQYREKWAAMVFSCEVCDTSYRSILDSRVKQATSRKRTNPEVGTNNGKTTEVLHYLKYLGRTDQRLGDIRTLLLKRSSRLTRHEIEAIMASS